MKAFELQVGDFDDVGINGAATGITDPVFTKIKKGSMNFLIWKIENLSVVALPRDQYGIFYDDEAYIIFAAAPAGNPVGIDSVQREVKGSVFEYHIHFWLGSQTPANKSGVAAYKTVELDNYFNNSTVQHRETQENESSRFRSYFKNGYRILKCLSKNPPKLYKVKGKSSPILVETEGVCWENFCSEDILILHTANILYCWMGRATDDIVKINAAKICVELKDEFSVKKIVFLDDGYEKTLSDADKYEFNKYLPLDRRLVMPESLTNNTDATNKKTKKIRLYKCSEVEGKYRVSELKSGYLLQSDLNSNDVFIVDQNLDGIWVWVGKRASQKERAEALRNARGFVKKKKYENTTQVTRVVDGHEPVEFKALFNGYWTNLEKSCKKKRSNIVLSNFDAPTMEGRPKLSAEMQLVDDGTGKVTLWRVKGQSSLVEVAQERHGIFFNGDCYILLYSFEVSVGIKQMIYYWLGSHANQEEINNTFTNVSRIYSEIKEIGFKCRVIQGREPPHFLQIFKGKLTIFQGKGTDFDESGRNLKQPMQYLLQVYGSSLSSSKSIQIAQKTSNLNSNYCFVLKRGKHAQIWCGNYSTGDQREMAKRFGGKDFILVLEGKEKSEFFEPLGGKTEKYSTEMLQPVEKVQTGRLFHCCRKFEEWQFQEVVFYEQRDLSPEDLMLLDFYDVIYIWIGRYSAQDRQKSALQIAIDYLQQDVSGRDLDIPIIELQQHYEPSTFKGFFSVWDSSFWNSYESIKKIRLNLEKKSNGNLIAFEGNGVHNTEKSLDSSFDRYEKYPLDILKEPNEKLPAKVNPLNKELHLTHDDFVTVLKMSYLEFEKLPRWKQQEIKKKVGLF